MTIDILLQGVLIRLAGTERIQFECDNAATVASALEQLATHTPALADELQRSACAIGDRLVSRDTPLQPGSELALIPPVSGG